MTVTLCAFAGALLGAGVEGVKWLSGNARRVELGTPAEELQEHPLVVIKLNELETICGVEAVQPLVEQVNRLVKIANSMPAITDKKVQHSIVQMAHRIRHNVKIISTKMWHACQDKPNATHRKLEENFSGVEEFVNGMVNNVDCLYEESARTP